MSDGITPIQPVSRIEPIDRIFGVAEMDPGLYQMIATSLCTLFQRIYSTKATTTLPLPLISLIETMQLPTNPSQKKKYSKKDKKNFYKISAFFKKTFDQNN
jgi:hypothetical protein